MIGFCEKWWLTAVRGCIACGFGGAVFLRLGMDAAGLAVVFGVFALLDGLVLLALGVVARDVLEQWWLVLVQGLVGVAVGIVALGRLGLGTLGLLALVAAWAVLTGIFEIEAGVRLRRFAVAGRSLLAGGGISLLAGIALIALPIDDPSEALPAIGAFGLTYGAALIVTAAYLRRGARRADPGAVA